MPAPPIPDDLLREVGKLRTEVISLNRHMQRRVQQEVAEQSVPREEFNQRVRRSGRRIAVGMLILLILVISLVGWNRVTLIQAQRQGAADFRRLVQTCRTTLPALPRDDLRFCEDRIPGFVELREPAKVAGAKAAQTEQRIKRLEAEVQKLTE
jgi:hypothetical protein